MCVVYLALRGALWSLSFALRTTLLTLSWILFAKLLMLSFALKTLPCALSLGSTLLSSLLSSSLSLIELSGDETCGDLFRGTPIRDWTRAGLVPLVAFDIYVSSICYSCGLCS